jgi:hypothetical protein
MPPLSPLLVFASVLIPLLLVTGCPTDGDDDDSGGQPTPGPDEFCDIDPAFNSPVIESVDACECDGTVDRCEELGEEEGSFQSRWSITVSDVDGDLLNPTYLLGVDTVPPYLTGRLEGSLGEGGTLNLDIQGCNLFARNTNVPFSVRMTDQAGCESEEFEDVWLVPEFEGDDTCASLCQALGR